MGDFTFMVMEILDKNLEDLLNENVEKKFSLKTTLIIADQLVSYFLY
jgi:hypothetical protein